MQIDFHHATTYVVARDAGFSHDDANVIAYAAQYVDDATSSGTILFDNRAAYNRISSAHKMLDARNAEELANHYVWMSFHFLPGNGGFAAGENPAGSFDAILAKGCSYGWHRLGTSHDLPVHCYKPNFLGSHWKHFHDAIQAHRFNVVYNILPKYGICAA
ncbi:MAG: hypothetical protein PHQ60_04930 [Sideroxydans sp.]|nr:hypothetical protein [Sideroxydans sp.]